MKTIAIAILIFLSVFAVGCPDFKTANDRLKNRLEELEKDVNGNKEDNINNKLADIETRIATEMRGQQIGMELIKQQLVEANTKNQLSDSRLQAEIAKNMQLQIDYARHQSGSGDLVVWLLALFAAAIFGALAIAALRTLLSRPRGNSTNIVYLNPQDREQIIQIMSQNPDAFKLIESRRR